MALLRQILQSSSPARFLSGKALSICPISRRPFVSSFPDESLDYSPFAHKNSRLFSGSPESHTGRTIVNENVGLPILGNVGMRLIYRKPKESGMVFRSFEHTGYPKIPVREFSSRPMDYARGFEEDIGNDNFGNSRFSRNNDEQSAAQNADVVHIKLLRNNTFVTLTDSKGNKKPGNHVSTSAGALPDKGGKDSRLGAEAAAEHVGRKARDIGVKSVVVKVNGFTFFKKKRQAIMGFREGYRRSRTDQSPIVLLEDTTRRPHNGCRRRKQRRI